MILAIDPGLARCGWAIVAHNTGRVEACGVIATERDRKASSSVDRARRSRIVAERLDVMRTAKVVNAIAAEAPLSFGPIQAVAPQIALWGALGDMANASRTTLYEVTAKTWQHAVMPEVEVAAVATKTKRRAKIDYKQLEAKLAAYMGREALAHIPKPDRTHALDAVGVGVLVALRPELATLI